VKGNTVNFTPEAFDALPADEKRAQFKVMPKENLRLYLDYKKQLTQNSVRWRPETWSNSDQYDPKALSYGTPTFEVKDGDDVKKIYGFEKILNMELGFSSNDVWQPFKSASIRVKLTAASIGIPKWFLLITGRKICITRTN
jgi:hypothetical protein